MVEPESGSRKSSPVLLGKVGTQEQRGHQTLPEEPEQELTRVKRGNLSIADCVSKCSATITNTRERQLRKVYTPEKNS